MNYVVDDIVKRTLALLAIPSVSGDCENALQLVERELQSVGLKTERTRKGALTTIIPGEDRDGVRRVVTAHIDTLGMVVHYIKENGRLRVWPLGGFDCRVFEGENCVVRTLDGAEIRGTLLADLAARHIIPEKKREETHTFENIEVRLDVATTSKKDTEALGIRPGDIVAFDARSEVTESGFIKSRFLDDKLSAAVIWVAALEMAKQKYKPAYTTMFYFSNYEEIGHGTPAIPDECEEIAAVDVGIVGQDCNSDEHAVTIVSRDSVLPYDRRVMRQLCELAEKNNIFYKVDAYQNYASDASVCVRSGMDVRALCFGPAIEASHNYERTHIDGVDATMRLLTAWLDAPMATEY